LKSAEAKDLNGDGKTDDKDFELFLRQLQPPGTTPPGTTPPGGQAPPKIPSIDEWLKGTDAKDLNADGKVDEKDYLLFLKRLTAPPAGQPPPTTQPPGTTPPGQQPPGGQVPPTVPSLEQWLRSTEAKDLNNDGKVNDKDFELFLRQLQPPGTTPPGQQPPGTTPPGQQPPGGTVPPTVPPLDGWLKSPEAKDLNNDGKIDDKDYELFLRQAQPPTGQPPGTVPPGTTPPGATPPGQQPPGGQVPPTIPSLEDWAKSAVAKDFNADGKIDDKDYELFRRLSGHPVTPPGTTTRPPGTTPPGATPPPGGTTPPPTGTEPPIGTQPPGTVPPGTTPPITTPPAGQPTATIPTFDQWIRSNQVKDLNNDGKINETDFELFVTQLFTPPGGIQPPGTQPPVGQPPTGQPGPTVPSLDQWLKSTEAKDLNNDGKIDEKDFELFQRQLQPPTGTQPPGQQPPGTTPPGQQPPGTVPPTGQPPAGQPPASGNQPPKVSFIGPQVIEAGKSSPSISFTVEDSQTQSSKLSVIASSSNTALVPDANIKISGGGSRRSLVITPAAGQSGTTDIKITVSDGDQGVATTTFTLSVIPPLPAVQPPTGTIPPVTTPPGTEPPGTVPPTGQPPSGQVPPTIPTFDQWSKSAEAKDLNGDGKVDDKDFEQFLRQLPPTTPPGTTPPTTTPPGTVPPGQQPPGGQPAPTIPPLDQWLKSAEAKDFNVDGKVDEKDYQLLLRQLQQPTAPPGQTPAGGTPSAQQPPNVPANSLPRISPVSHQILPAGKTSVTISFTVSDAETPVSELTLFGQSSDQSFVPNENISFAGSGFNRLVTVSVVEGRTGTATITITVSDSNGGKSFSSFGVGVGVQAGTTPPTQQPPGNVPPGHQPPATQPPGGQVPPTIPTFDQWSKSADAKDLNADGKIDENDYRIFAGQAQTPPGAVPPGTVPPAGQPPGTLPPPAQPSAEAPPAIVPQLGAASARPATEPATAALPGGQIPNVPTILRDPENIETIAGAPATFSVTVVGKLPLAYQWRFNGNPIPGATSSVLVIPDVQQINAGSYSVEISNTDGRATSKDATLRIVTPLRIIVQPVSQTVLPGDNVAFSVEATGAGALRYQWQFNSVDLPGATSSKLELRNVSASNTGVYSVIVRSDTTSVTSLGAFLAINELVKIVRQPRTQSAVEGGRATFSVEVAGTPPLKYQWQFNSVDIQGQTSPVLEIPSVSAANAGQYSVVVGNRTGSVQSEKASLIVSAGVSILRQPQSRVALADEPASFSVTASGTPPLGYQWRFNGADLSGATDSTLIVPNVSAASEGAYTVVVRNIAGSVTSEPATLRVNSRPRVTQQPQSQTVIAGGTAAFSVAAEGTAPLSYQWKFKGADIAGATGATLTLQNVQATDAGTYHAVVSNASGPVFSEAALLIVNVPITIVAQPQSQTVPAGGSASFTVAAAGTPPLAYQWKRNGANLPAATSSTLTINNAQAAQSGSFTVEISNAAGSTTSAPAILTVNVPPSITRQPGSQNVAPGATVTFSVTATGEPPLSYQWQKNGQKIDGATGPTLTLSNVQAADAGSYDVVVTSSGGTMNSAAATLTLTLTVVQGGTTSNEAAAAAPVTTREGSFDGGSNVAVGGQMARRNAPPRSGDERWFSWRAPASGIVTFNTAGSTFDTVLAIYTGTAPNNLTLVGADDDRGGFFNSEVKFNVVLNTTYLVRVIGYGGAAGRIVVNFKLDETTARLPVITTEPKSQVVSAGANVTFTVAAQGTALTYQWYANGTALPGATAELYTVTNVQEKDALRYTVRIRSGAGAQAVEVESLPATIQIGTPQDSARDKFKNVPILGGTTPFANQSLIKNAGGSVSRGYSGSQVFNTFGATKEQGEPNHADEIGGASQWFSYPAPDTGTLRVSTEGSSFDTVLAVYTGPGTDFASLKLEAFDNNSGADGKTSVATVKVTKGTTYFIAVDGVKGATGTVKISYSMGAAPVISTQPASQSVKVGETVGFFVAVTDPLGGVSATTAPVTYQWFKDGVKIAGENSRSFALLNVQIANGGDYTVEASNFAGTAKSQAAKLTINVGLSVTTPPENQTAKVGDSVEFRAVASGTEPIKYQWRFNGADIAGATSATYRINSAQAANVGLYTLFAQNDISSVESTPAILTINQLPVITTQPADQAVLLGGKATFAVTATGTAPLSYQWRQNGVNITGANGATLEINGVAAANAGEYTVVVSNPVDSALSAPARLEVRIPLAVAEQPQSQTVNSGSSVVLSVRAAGSGPFAYQWRKNGTAIANANGPTLIFSNVQASDAGQYTVVIASGAETVTSAAAALTVSATPTITEQPRSQVAFVGGPVTFRVTASGTAPLSYQWFRNGEPIPAATASTLTIPNVKVDLAGSYAVLVSNSAGSTVSDVALLTTRQVVSDLQKGLNGFQFLISVPEGKRARLQSSTDLLTWTDLTPTPITGTTDIQDTEVGGSGLKFYRVVLE